MRAGTIYLKNNFAACGSEAVVMSGGRAVAKAMEKAAGEDFDRPKEKHKTSFWMRWVLKHLEG